MKKISIEITESEQAILSGLLLIQLTRLGEFSDQTGTHAEINPLRDRIQVLYKKVSDAT